MSDRTSKEIAKLQCKHYDEWPDACETPLIELLQNVPEDARMTYEHHSTHHQMIPVGHLCKHAADHITELERLSPAQCWEDNKRLTAQLEAVKECEKHNMHIFESSSTSSGEFFSVSDVLKAIGEGEDQTPKEPGE